MEKSKEHALSKKNVFALDKPGPYRGYAGEDS
jgi:hypothetical protein